MASAVQIRLEGADHLIKELDKLETKLAKKIMLNACMAGGRVLRKKAKELLSRGTARVVNGVYHGSKPGAPPYMYTKNLVKSLDIKGIRKSKTNGSESWAIVGHRKGPGAKYVGYHSWMLEYGTKKMKARPYIRPAAAAAETDIANAMIAVLKRELYG